MLRRSFSPFRITLIILSLQNGKLNVLILLLDEFMMTPQCQLSTPDKTQSLFGIFKRCSPHLEVDLSKTSAVLMIILGYLWSWARCPTNMQQNIIYICVLKPPC